MTNPPLSEHTTEEVTDSVGETKTNFTPLSMKEWKALIAQRIEEYKNQKREDEDE